MHTKEPKQSNTMQEFLIENTKAVLPSTFEEMLKTIGKK